MTVRAIRATTATSPVLRERVADLLSPTPTPRDELVRITGAPAAMVSAALTELVLAGRAELAPGGLAVKA
jgi:DNA processing protein